MNTLYISLASLVLTARVFVKQFQVKPVLSKLFYGKWELSKWGLSNPELVTVRRVSIFIAIILSTAHTLAVPLKPITKDNTVFLWDIHDVILKKDTSLLIKKLLKYPRKWGALRKSSFRLWRQMRALSKQKQKTGEIYADLALKHKNKDLACLIMYLANTQKPIRGTVNLIKDLKKRGYAHHIGSNIGPVFFANLQKRMSALFNSTLFDLDKSQVASYADKKQLYKPDPAFFASYLAKNNLDPHTTTIIFIDDKLENIEVANKMGLIGIHFTSPKQLRKDLRALGCAI
ncbi:MAG: hypothetical protein NT124_02995 [Candidatus Dependentiae bacterium]|nr:hypothetical protein [Candidatus Dependentiae bacterium]